MRNPRSPAWARCAAFAAAWLVAVAGLVPGAAAEEKFKQLLVFGDSYADLTLSDTPATNLQAPPGFALSVWRVYPVSLAANLGGAQMFDFAVGGARASDAGPAPVGWWASTWPTS
jgi:phospholipase/lecithinase/hemolysin